MNTPVSFELAKLLKEKNINIFSEYRYTDFNGIERLEKDASEIFPYAPTIVEVVMWLYEKHDIWIEVVKPVRQKLFRFNADDNDLNVFTSVVSFDSPKNAYEAAIEYVLKYFIK